MNKFISTRMFYLKYSILLIYGLVLSCKTFANKPILKVASIPVSCYGKADGEIWINFSDKLTDTFQITVMDSSSKILTKFGNSNNLPLQVKNLKAGIFKVLFYSEGKTEEYPVKISVPELLKANVIKIIELKGHDTSVRGTLEVNPSGGNPPYILSWSDNTGKQTGKIVKDLPKGIYTCTIDDSKHCGPVIATFFLYDEEIKKYNNKK